MPAPVVFLFACATSYVLAVDLHVYPTEEELPPRMTPEEVDHASSVLTALGLASWFACPLVGRMTNKMVTLPDGYTYDQDHVIASCGKADALKSPHYQYLTIPASLAFAFVNLDLMETAMNAESIKQSVSNGEIPAAVRPWIGSPLRQPIWICADGRSRLMTSFKHPFTVEQLGMLLALENGDFCFRNIHLEHVVDEICRRVDCATADVRHIRETPVMMDTAHAEPGAHHTLSISSLLWPNTAAPSSRPSVASLHGLSIDTSSGETSTAINDSPTSAATSISGSSPLGNHHQPNALVPPVGADDAASIYWTGFANAIPWPSASEVQPAPSLPSALSSAWAATIAHTRDLDNKSFWDRHHLCSTASNIFHAALFWARQYRTTCKPDDMELPPKPSNPDDMRDWQANCHRFFQAAEDIVVNAISEKRDSHVAVSRHARGLQILAKQLGLVKYERHSNKRRRSTYSDHDIVDTIPWPSMSAISPAPSLPRVMSSAWAATVGHTRSLDDRNRWDWRRLTGTDQDAIYDALFWVRQYTTKWKPPEMSLPRKPASSDGFREWQASCYRFFKAAEDRVVEAIWEKQSDDADDAVEGSARFSRLSSTLRCRLRNSGLPINTERKHHKCPKGREPGAQICQVKVQMNRVSRMFLREVLVL